MIEKTNFGSTDLYTITGGELSVSFMTLGATMTSLKFRGNETVLSFDNPERYIAEKDYVCQTVGRYANRIGASRFTMDGTEYVLPDNENGNQLHGGPDSYNSRIWDARIDGETLEMSILSPDGDNGFPGQLKMTMRFSVKENTLHIDFLAETDKKTVFAPTVHPYFLVSDYRKALLQVNAKTHLECDAELIPTGRILPCEGAYDFSQPTKIGLALDDCFPIESEYACRFTSDDYAVEMWTDMPAAQVFTGKHSSVAIEPEFYPDSPNHPEFPSTVLNPGESFRKYAEYKFFAL